MRSFISELAGDLRPEGLLQFGFFFALMLTPFAPGYKYLGWTIMLLGLIKERKAFGAFIRELPALPKAAFLIILVYGAFVTFLNQRDPELWAKGYSLVVEFAFCTLAAAFLLRTQRAFNKWQLYIKIFIIIYGVLCIIGYMSSGTNTSIFSLYTFSSTITIPLLSSIFSVFFFPPAGRPMRVLGISAALLAAVMVLLGFSSGAMISDLFCIAVMIAAYRPKFRTVAVGAAVCAVLLACTGAYVSTLPETSTIKQHLRKESAQLSDFRDLSNFTTKRNEIWEAAYAMAKERPLGIGWGQFEREFQNKIDSGELPADTIPVCSTHNEFVGAMTEGGWVSLFAFIMLWAGFLSILIRNRRRMSKRDFVILSGALAGMFMFSLVGSIVDERKLLAFYFWTNFGAILGQCSILKNGQARIGG